MKKTFSNTDIKTIFNTLNKLKGRNDILIGDMDIFWAIRYNTSIFKEKVLLIQEITNDMIQSYFTDENTIEIDGKKVLKPELQQEISEKINDGLRAIDNQTMEINYSSIHLNALKSMSKVNENKLSMLEMTVLEQFIDEDAELQTLIKEE